MLWKIEVYESAEDAEPVRTGFANADSEEMAIKIGVREMGEAIRADFGVVRAKSVACLPDGVVFWVS